MNSTDAETVSSSSISLEWEEIEEGTLYKTYRVTIDSEWGSSMEDVGTSLAFTAINLVSNTNYGFSVIASNSAGDGTPSETESSITCKLS